MLDLDEMAKRIDEFRRDTTAKKLKEMPKWELDLIRELLKEMENEQ